MPSKMSLQMMSVHEALRQSYTEISVIRNEITAWLRVRGPKSRRDVTIITQKLEWAVEDLNKISTPELATLPKEIANTEICANIEVSSKSRMTRVENVSAKLRPVLVQFRKHDIKSWIEIVEKDCSRLDNLYVPSAYEKT